MFGYEYTHFFYTLSPVPLRVESKAAVSADCPRRPEGGVALSQIWRWRGVLEGVSGLTEASI